MRLKLLLSIFCLASLCLGAGLPRKAIKGSDLKSISCNFDSAASEKLTRSQIVKKLKLKGHDLGSLNKSSFSRSHVEDIYRAIKLFPNWMKFGLGASGLLYKSDTQNKKASASYVDSKVIINPNNWNRIKDRNLRVAIIFHELSHAIADRIKGLDSSKSWENIDGGWFVSRGYRRDGSIYAGSPKRRRSIVSLYAKNNPAEDFAESLSVYRIKPDRLKAVSMNKYNFIKDVIFFGVEYINNDDCSVEISELVSFEKNQALMQSKLFNYEHYYKKAYRYVEKKMELGFIETKEQAFESFVSISLQNVVTGLANKKTGTIQSYRQVHEYLHFIDMIKNLNLYINDFGQKQIEGLLNEI